ncbi:T9SS type A sorting domain-containing protein [Winogradskyella sp.]|nr:T9SS type A sorting domain-containing protein [Winogradskyella sp.]MDB9754723.1 T9SS type A sorting domain-containing protein [Winogradskyella sp.]MDC0007197.1 T9SS type A sorting domain-containing protein [Winogradskyella sp.]MDC1503751.1 T9SS type A sorting domain-containing protein [Winogradskyella sp.]
MTNLTDMLLNATLSLTNYDNTLIGWNTLDTVGGEIQIPTGINFHGGNSKYCIGETERTDLINTYGWTITDGGLDCTTLSVPTLEIENLVLYPNPVVYSFQIKGLTRPDAQLQIVNMQGQLVQSINNYNAEEVSIEALAAGVYFVNINSNNAYKTLKIIKKD